MNNEFKTLKFCVKIFKSGKEYITEAITHISEKNEKNNYLYHSCILLCNILDEDSRIRFLLYITEIIKNKKSTIAFETAESPLSHVLLKICSSNYEDIFTSAIVHIDNKNQLKDIIKYGIYLVKKNNLDILTIDFLNDVFFNYIKFKIYDNNN